MSTQGTIEVLDNIDITSYFATGTDFYAPITIANPNNGYTYYLSATFPVSGSTYTLFSNRSLGSSTATLYSTTFRIKYEELDELLYNNKTTTRVTVTFTLTTKLDGSTIGTDTQTADIYFSGNANTRPDISNVTFGEDGGVSGLESHHYLQNKSVIKATFLVSTIIGSDVSILRVILNGRSYVKHYNPNGNDTMSVSFTPTDIGSFLPVCYVVDSRGLVGSFMPNFSLLITEYFAPKITSYTIGRVNGVGTTVEVKFTGSVASAKNNGTELNVLSSAVVSWGISSSESVTFSTAGTGFSADTTLSGTYSESQVFTFTLVLTDNFGTATTLTVKVPKANPVMYIKDGEVDVNGTLKQNAIPVMGFVKDIGSLDLNTLHAKADTGIYLSSTTIPNSQHPPIADIYGVLEVIADESGRAMQRFTQTDDNSSSGIAPASWIRIYRLYSGQMRWSNWYQITLTV